MSEIFDLLLTGGTVLNPASKVRQELDRGYHGWAHRGHSTKAAAGSRKENSGRPWMLCYPGLIDFHVHSYWGVNPYGFNSDSLCLAQRRDDGYGCRIRRSGEFPWLQKTRP